MDDHYVRVTIVISEHGDDHENGVRFMEGFMETHPETGPSVSQNTRDGTLSVTFGVESDDVSSALDHAKKVFLDGAMASGLEATQVLSIEATLVPVEESDPSEDREPVPA